MKDMDQWVAAICQAGIQYIQVSHSPLPGATTGKSVSRRVQDFSEPIYEAGEIYDDAGPVTDVNEVAELQVSDEEYYEAVTNVHQRNTLESKPDFEVASEEICPPLPPRRLPPPVPQDGLSHQESVHDDIDVSNKQSQYENMVDVDGEEGHTTLQPNTDKERAHKTAQPQQSAKHKTQYNAEENNDEGEEDMYDDIEPGDESPQAKKSQPSTDSVHKTAQPQRSAKHKTQYNAEENNDEGEEDMYDDIGTGDKSPQAKKSQPSTDSVHTTAQPQRSAEKNNDEGEEDIYDDAELDDESPKAKKSPVLQNKYSITNRGVIKNRAKALEERLLKDGYQSKPKPSNQIVLDRSTLHKPIQNNGKDTLFSSPQMPAASQNSKSDIFNQPLQTRSNLHKPNKTAEKITTVPSSDTQHSSQPPELPPRSYLKR
jgi:hypothetical protein